MSRRMSSTPVLALALVLAAGLPSARAAAPVATVAVGEVVIQVEGDTPSSRALLIRTLRTALSEELTTLSAAGSTGKRPLVVSATLTRLLTEQRDKRARATANISLVLRRADDQVLFAELRGRASAEESSDSVAAVQQMALRGAVRGAISRLPEAVRRAP
jgi:hypothetical protein